MTRTASTDRLRILVIALLAGGLAALVLFLPADNPDLRGEGERDGIRVKIDAGAQSRDIAGLLQAKVGIDSAGFMRAVNDKNLMAELGVDAPSLEGYLFPMTYHFPRGLAARTAVTLMVNAFFANLPADTERRLKALGFSLNDMVALASIVEWEVLHYREARIVSSVYHNRLDEDMKLQADPTVAYALGIGPSKLRHRHLKVDSPYNTYKYRGLPPGAINNPGKEAIKAALHPRSTDYLFFMSRGDGTHIFSTTFDEHKAARRELRKR